jgi:hypothetical protein
MWLRTSAFNGKNKLYIESAPLKTVMGDIEHFVMPLVRGTMSSLGCFARTQHDNRATAENVHRKDVVL